MTVEQFVMAYGAEQDRLRALLTEGFASLRPVLRINAEVRDGKTGALEFNTAAEKADNRGWVNIGRWDDVPFTKDGKKTTFTLPELTISFTGVGIEGGCPAEKDNAGVLSRSSMTVKRSLNELETAGLIMRVRQGVGEPNRIYVLIPGKEDAALA